jgi:hypothetical protein
MVRLTQQKATDLSNVGPVVADQTIFVAMTAPRGCYS